MNSRSILGAVAIVAVIVGGLYWLGPQLLVHWRPAEQARSAAKPGAREPAYLDVLPEVVELNGIRTVAAKLPTRPRELNVSGQLSLDPNRLVHVHARFPGQVVELATIEEANAIAAGPLKTRRVVSFMDHVAKGQVLGVLWSKDLGEKKSELVASLTRLRTDQINLDRLNALWTKGFTTEKSVREAEYQVDSGENNVERARWTLRSWLLTDEEIGEVEAEAARIHRERSQRSLGKIELEANWARVDIVAPIDGTIVEKNVVAGGIVDTDDDLFKIADLDSLIAWGQVYEEDLPVLQSLPRPIPWKIRVSSNAEGPPTSGAIDLIGDTIDPNTHMALVGGPVPNQEGNLFVGQFITATIALPQESGVVEIPTRALVEDGNQSLVLVQTDPKRNRFFRRRVAVVKRHSDVVFVRSQLTSQQKSQGFEELHVGDRVVAAGALELKEALFAQQPESPGQAAE
ncbi:MAG TPA: efflux RND transporter periplasmic adaptor subunit [Pirellulales bacterium]|nr:efflux RND transporter periplasmic adaptor subunit [Pirellulales bacterium]